MYFEDLGLYTLNKKKLALHMCIENFSGYNQITIEPDFYVQILLYNMLEKIKQDAKNLNYITKKDLSLNLFHRFFFFSFVYSIFID